MSLVLCHNKVEWTVARFWIDLAPRVLFSGIPHHIMGNRGQATQLLTKIRFVTTVKKSQENGEYWHVSLWHAQCSHNGSVMSFCKEIQRWHIDSYVGLKVVNRGKWFMQPCKFQRNEQNMLRLMLGLHNLLFSLIHYTQQKRFYWLKETLTCIMFLQGQSPK